MSGSLRWVASASLSPAAYRVRFPSMPGQGPASGLFGRHVGRSPKHVSGPRQLHVVGLRTCGQPEIRDHRLTVAVDHDVGGFQISVHDVLSVSLAQRQSQLVHQARRVTMLDATTALEILHQGLARNIGHDDEVMPARFPRFIHGTNVRMPHREAARACRRR